MQSIRTAAEAENGAQDRADKKLNKAWRSVSEAVDELRDVPSSTGVTRRLHAVLREIEQVRDQIR